MSEPRIIKKYPNRRLYDPFESRYVTLTEIQKMAAAGVDFIVIEKATGEDVTRSVLLQLIAAQEQRGVSLLPHEFLLQMIRSREQGLPALTASYLEQSLNLFRREGAADRRTADEDLAAMAQRMAQQHYQRWHTAQDEIDRKLEKLIAQHERD